jgi:hypothetical protein
MIKIYAGTLAMALFAHVPGALASAIPPPTPDSHALAAAHTFDGTVILKDNLGKDATQCVDLSVDGRSCVKTGPMAIADAIVTALLAAYNDEPNLSGNEKFTRWRIAMKIKDDPGAIALSLKEAGLVERLVGKAYPPMLVGQIYQAIDPNYQSPDSP